MQMTLPAGLRQFDTTSLGLVADVEDVPVNLPGLLGLGEPPTHTFNDGWLDIDMRRRFEPDPWAQCKLSQDEWVVIQSYFPKRYGFEGEPLEKLIYTEIPQPVLELWARAKASGAFYAFQLRTTEGQGANAIASIVGTLDPVLIGFVRDKKTNRLIPHRLAQWGLDNVLDASMPRMARRVAELCLLKAKSQIREGYKFKKQDPSELLSLLLIIGILVMLLSKSYSWFREYGPGLSLMALFGTALSGILLTSYVKMKWASMRLAQSGHKGERVVLKVRVEKILEYQAARRILASA